MNVENGAMFIYSSQLKPTTELNRTDHFATVRVDVRFILTSIPNGTEWTTLSES